MRFEGSHQHRPRHPLPQTPRLGITVGTVKAHVKAILGKLGARTRTEAAAIARRRGLTDLVN